MWTLALISMSWILTNLKRKTENVHCQNVDHKHQDRNPRLCHIRSEFHKELYDECLKSLEDTVRVMKDNPPQVVPEKA